MSRRQLIGRGDLDRDSAAGDDDAAEVLVRPADNVTGPVSPQSRPGHGQARVQLVRELLEGERIVHRPTEAREAVARRNRNPSYVAQRLHELRESRAARICVRVTHGESPGQKRACPHGESGIAGLFQKLPSADVIFHGFPHRTRVKDIEHPPP